MQDSPPSDPQAVSVTFYAAGDEREICALFEHVWGSPKSIERWQWQFAANPYEGPQVAVARDATTGDLVGHCAVMPASINWLGRAVKAGQMVDSMVDSRYRGFGIYERTAHACYERGLQSKFEMLYGVPNRASFGVRLRNLSWERLFTLPCYSTRLSCDDFLKRIAPLPGLPGAANFIYRAFCSVRLSWRIAFARLLFRGLKFRHSNSVPSNYDTFWNAVKQSETISIWKDRAYLTWRYDRCPDRQYEYFFIENEKQAIAVLCVASISDDGFMLCELMAADRNAMMAQYLLSLVTHAALRLRSKRIEFYGWSPDFFDQAFKNFAREGTWNYTFCIRCLGEGALSVAARNPANWTVTFGDTDVA